MTGPNATSSFIWLPRSLNWLVYQKSLSLTFRQDLHILRGASVTFTVSPASHYLYSLQLPPIESIQTLLLIGSDYPPLITPVEPVHLGPPNCPAAIKTCLGWTLQGPNQEIKHHLPRQQCLFSVRLVYWPVLTSREIMETICAPLLQWETHYLLKVRSRGHFTAQVQDYRVRVDGVVRYATPLLPLKHMPLPHASPDTTLQRSSTSSSLPGGRICTNHTSRSSGSSSRVVVHLLPDDTA